MRTFLFTMKDGSKIKVDAASASHAKNIMLLNNKANYKTIQEVKK